MAALTSVATLGKENDVDSMCVLDVNVTLPSGLSSDSDVRVNSNECRQGDRPLSGFLAKTVVHDRDCLICCEAGWPEAAFGISWLDAGRGVWLYSKEELIGDIESLLPESVKVVSRLDATSLIRENNIISIIIGSLLFVSDLFNDTNQFPILNSIVVVPYTRFRKKELVSAGLKWMKVAHEALGGITTTAWSIGVPSRLSHTKLAQLSPSFGLSRTLKHGIKDGELGKVIQPPTSTLLNERMSLSALVRAHALPCYRACTGWVWRELTPFEVGLIMDVNELSLQKICNILSEDALKREFLLRSLPGKVSQLLHSIVRTLWKDDKKTETLSARLNEKSVSAQSSVYSVIGTKSVGNFLLDGDGDAAAGSTTLTPFLAKEADYLIEYGQKASKSDDALIPVELWDRCVLRDHFEWLPYSTKVAHALSVLRNKLGIRVYAVNLVKSFFRYIRKTYGRNWLSLAFHAPSKSKKGLASELIKELRIDLSVGLDSLVRALRSSWWEWLDGSTCYFWRWPEEVRKNVRDGFPVWVETKLPEYKRSQMFKGLNKEQMKALEIKVHKVISRRYLNKGYVKSLINYFAVPKGVDDIRVVYDGTKSGLTDAVWVPNFYMPSIDSLLMYCSAATWYSDMDLGEMFLNYFMDPKIRPFCGVDVSHFIKPSSKAEGGKQWLQWNRIFMGFRSSPYYAVRTFSYCVDMIRGDYLDSSNPYGYSKVRINLPGSDNYTPCLPWISKMQGDEESSDIIPYMDDGRPYGGGERLCRKAAKKASKLTQYLGQQDAARKYRPPSQQPGPWCGAFIAERNGSVWAYVSDAKWNKAKSYISGWLEDIG